MQYSNQHSEFCLENQLSIFRGLHLREKEALDRNQTTLIIKKGDFIYREGDRSKGLICLASGKYKIYRIGVGGREQIIKLVRPSELAGYRTIFQSTAYTDSAAAIEDSVVCCFEKYTLLNILKNNPDFSFKLMKLLCEELTFVSDRMISLTQKHVRGRLTETLLMLSEIYGFELDGKTINVSLSRADIAHYSNMTTSNAIRTLSNLESEGRIELKRRKITLTDIHGLEQISTTG